MALVTARGRRPVDRGRGAPRQGRMGLDRPGRTPARCGLRLRGDRAAPTRARHLADLRRRHRLRAFRRGRLPGPLVAGLRAGPRTAGPRSRHHAGLAVVPPGRRLGGSPGLAALLRHSGPPVRRRRSGVRNAPSGGTGAASKARGADDRARRRRRHRPANRLARSRRPRGRRRRRGRPHPGATGDAARPDRATSHGGTARREGSSRSAARRGPAPDRGSSRSPFFSLPPSEPWPGADTPGSCGSASSR